MKGTVTEFYKIRGYGYLRDEQGEEICFYDKDIQSNDRCLNKGESVEFDFYSGHGTRAKNLRKSELIKMKV